MKIETIHHNGEEVQAIFLYNYKNGDFNVRTHSLKKSNFKSNKNQSAANVYLVLNENADMGEIKSELIRAKTFFSSKDGLLFGALVGLTKQGSRVEKWV